MDILLYRVGRNLNRCYRTAEAFGIENLLLLECAGEVRGNLFKSAGHVKLERILDWPNMTKALALETVYNMPIWDANWADVEIIVLGGETSGLPACLSAKQKAIIPMAGRVSGLTVEAALSIALWEWYRNGFV